MITSYVSEELCTSKAAIESNKEKPAVLANLLNFLRQVFRDVTIT